MGAHVAAASALFSAIALLFWYILQLVMVSRTRFSVLIPDDQEMQDREPQTAATVSSYSSLRFSFSRGWRRDSRRHFASPNGDTLLLIFWIPLTMLHEAGHAFAARWVGWRVIKVTVGFGRVVSQRRIFRMPVEFRLFPLVGMVEIVPSSLESPRLKNAFIYAAGPGIELLLVGLIIAILGWDTVTSAPESYGVAALQAICLAGLVGVFINLLPLSATPGAMTDGMGIVQSPFLPRVYFEGMMVRPLLTEARDFDGRMNRRWNYWRRQRNASLR